MKEQILLKNAHVLTMNQAQPRAEAVLIEGSHIKAVGPLSQVKPLAGKCEVVDLGGKTLLPGFVDCHMHPILTAYFLINLDLNHIRSIEELLECARLKARETPPDQWILGIRFNEEGTAEQRLPALAELDQAVPGHPLLILRYCGHLAIANSKALALANITPETADPHGGEIERRADGTLTGVLRETAISLVTDQIAPPEWEVFGSAVERAFRQLAANGITGVHGILQTSDAGPSGKLGYLEVSALKAFREKIPQRLYLMIMTTQASEIEEARASELHDDSPGSMCRVGPWKIICDGSLGGHSAVMFEPYTDAADMRGILVWSESELEGMIREAHMHGMQLAVHCIGDRMAHIVLEILAQVLKESPARDHRHRIEHASVMPPQLIRRAKELGLIMSVQPPFIYSEKEWLSKRLGQRVRYTYPFRSMIESGLVLCAGSDAPVESADPILGIYSSVNRLGVAPDEAIGVEDAIRMYTTNAAYASFEENIKGTIESGKLADLVVLSDDPLSIPPANLRDISVEMTMVGGTIIYSK
ncbi:MAG: amidohydrolase [Candidatus Abyssubacteria bacterium]